MTFQVTGVYCHVAWGTVLQLAHTTLVVHLKSEPVVQAALDEHPTWQTVQRGPGWWPRQAAHRQALSWALRSWCCKVSVLDFPETLHPGHPPC